MNWSDLILHPATEAALARIASDPVQALLLTGPDGAGKGTVARRVAAAALGVVEAALQSHPYARIVTPDEKNTISIDAIRTLQQFTRLKVPGRHQSISRVVIIEHAGAMTTEAQNAFLKLLEEPPAGTMFILTAPGKRSLLPTIISRLQAMPVTQPAESPVQDFFIKKGHASKDVTQAFFLSGGLPGLMASLLADSEHHLIQSVAAAKDFLAKPLFDRLAMVDTLSKQRDAAIGLMQALARISHTMVVQAAAAHQPAKLKQWHKILAASQDAITGLEQSANTKLLLTNTILQL